MIIIVLLLKNSDEDNSFEIKPFNRYFFNETEFKPIDDYVYAFCVDLYYILDCINSNIEPDLGGLEISSTGKEWVKLLTISDWMKKLNRGENRRYPLPKNLNNSKEVISAIMILDSYNNQDIIKKLPKEKEKFILTDEIEKKCRIKIWINAFLFNQKLTQLIAPFPEVAPEFLIKAVKEVLSDKNQCISFIANLVKEEIIPNKNKKGKFINTKKKEESFYHIYYNDCKEEIKRNYLSEDDKVSKIKIIIDSQFKSFDDLFSESECVESISFKKFYRNNITNMTGIFYGCSSLERINFSNFNTNDVTNMNYMFCRCSSLKELNLSNFNTSKVTSMIWMFKGCSSLKELILSNFNTTNVTDMNSMFNGCSSLKELNLSSFNTCNLTNMNSMLNGCSSLKEIVLSSFNTSKVTNMHYMFNACSSLNELNLSNFNTNKVTDMSHMFSLCTNLRELNISNFNINNVSKINNMFNQCLKQLKMKIKLQKEEFPDNAFE